MIYIASDHAGFELKKVLIDYLKSKGEEVKDMGPEVYDKLDDYPDFIYPCAKRVGQESGSLGIVIGWSGQGEAFAANKAKGVRAVVYYGGNPEIIKLSKIHNNANVLSLGAGFLSVDEAKAAVDLWLATDFLNEERHVRRIEKITKLENHG